MFQTKEELVEELNYRTYKINVIELMNMLIKNRTEKILLQEIINEAFKINVSFTDNNWRSKIKSALGIRDIKKETLQNKFLETSSPLFNIVDKYITAEKKVRDLEALYIQLNITKELESEPNYEKGFKFGLNSAGFVQILYPTFMGLNKEEILIITGLRQATQFESMETMMEYLTKYESCFIKGRSSNFLIKGKILYTKIYETELMLRRE